MCISAFNLYLLSTLANPVETSLKWEPEKQCKRNKTQMPGIFHQLASCLLVTRGQSWRLDVKDKDWTQIREVNLPPKLLQLRGEPRSRRRRVCACAPGPQVGATGARLAGLPSPQGVPALALRPGPLGTDLSSRVPGVLIPAKSALARMAHTVAAGEDRCPERRAGLAAGALDPLYPQVPGDPWRALQDAPHPTSPGRGAMLPAEKPLTFGTRTTVYRQERKPGTSFVNVISHFLETHRDLIPLLAFVLQNISQVGPGRGQMLYLRLEFYLVCGPGGYSPLLIWMKDNIKEPVKMS
ncbi:hypothetical protein ACRRTK_010219 [Alexandromys fortis]